MRSIGGPIPPKVEYLRDNAGEAKVDVSLMHSSIELGDDFHRFSTWINQIGVKLNA